MNIARIITTLLFAAFATYAVANPTVTRCCDCFKITVLGMNPDGSFKANKDGDYIAHVKVEKVETSGCPTSPFKVSIGAALYDGNTYIDASSRLVELGGPVTLEFKLTAEEARMGDTWVFDSACVETTDTDAVSGTTPEGDEKREIAGCKRQEFPLEGCAACGESCAYTGETSASNGSTSKHGATGSGGFSAQIPTTRSAGGDAEGTLSFLTDDFANPGRAALYAAVPSDFTVNRSGGLVTSIQTGTTTIEVAPADSALLALDPNAFTITHKDSTSAVFRTTTISFVTEGGVQRLRMDSTFDGSTIRREQTRPQPGTLILEEGRVVGGTFEPLSRDTLLRTEPSPGKRVERRTLAQRPAATAPWAVTSDNETTEEKQIAGWVTTKQVTDPDGAALTSNWTYYQPGELTGPGGATEGLGRLKQHTSYDGSTSFHTYTLNQTSVTSPYAGNPAGKVTKSTWNPGTLTSTNTTEINGILVSKSVTIHTPTTETNITHTSATGTLTTVTHYLPSGQDFGGNPVKTLHPDGTLTTYAYTRNPGGGSTTVTENGSTTDSNTVAKGTRSITTTNSRGTTILSKTEAIGYGTGNTVFSSMAVTSIDNLGRPLTTAHHPTSLSVTGEVATATGAAYTTTTEYSCCGTAKETDMYGIPTFHAYDHLQRQIKTNRLGVTSETHYNGLTTETHRYPETVTASLSPALNGTAATLVGKSVTNLAGTLRESWSPDPTSATPGALVKSSSTATTYQPAPGLSTRTVTTTPDNFTQTTDSFLDGRTAATYGALSPDMAYAYTVNPTGEFTKQAYTSGATYYEAQGTQSDWAGRSIKSGSLSPGTGAISSLASSVLQSSVSNNYNSLGQMVKSTDPDGVITLMAYNAEGEATITAIDLNQNNQIDYGVDTVSSTESVPVAGTSSPSPSTGLAVPSFRTIGKVWQDGAAANQATIVSWNLRSANGLSSSSLSLGVANPSTTLTTFSGNGNWTQKTTSPDGTYTLTTYTGGLMDISENFGSDNSLISSTSMRDGTNAPLSGYDDFNRPVHRRDSRNGVSTTAYLSTTSGVVKFVTDPGNRTTAYVYDIRSRQIKTILPDETETTTTYDPRGGVSGRTGSQTYPVSYTYDYAGRQLTMTTYGTETAVTSWIYSEDRGFLVEKNYDGETDNGIADPDYTYTAAGRPLTRTWERGVVTTYAYDNGGRLVSVAYSNETNGYTTPDIGYTYDALSRIVEVSRGGILHTKFTYNPVDLRRLNETQQIDTLNQTVTYTYEDGSNGTLEGRPNGYTFTHGAATWSYDSAGRISLLSNPQLSNVSFAYGYDPNSKDLVKTVTGPAHTVTNTWEPTRDVLATKINATTAGAVSSFRYTVNAIGQRVSVRPVVDGNNDPVSTYTPAWDWSYNPRGELTEAEDKNGANHRAYEYDEIGNRTKAIEALAADLAAAPNNYVANALNQYTTANTLTPTHDPDGNLTTGQAKPLGSSSLVSCVYEWDGENRLIAVKRGDTGATLVTYQYDHQSRLIARTAATTTVRYLYQGWNRIAEYADNESGHTPDRVYLCGMDLSGSMQGSGGVGGLLAMTVHGTSPENLYPTYDGNGNISEYINGNGVKVAHFEYDPFGNLTVDSEDNAENFAYRFSTKPQDTLTGLYYYGYRWYEVNSARWPSRDPIQEDGGYNLYSFVDNNPILKLDLFGLIGEDYFKGDEQCTVSMYIGHLGKDDPVVDGSKGWNAGRKTFEESLGADKLEGRKASEVLRARMSMMMCMRSAGSMYPIPGFLQPGGYLGVASLVFDWSDGLNISGNYLSVISYKKWKDLSTEDRARYTQRWDSPAHNGGLNPVQYNPNSSIDDNLRAWDTTNQAVGYARFFLANWVLTLKEAGEVAELEKKDMDSGKKCYCKVLKVRFRMIGSDSSTRHDSWLNEAGNAGVHSINRLWKISESGVSGSEFSDNSFTNQLYYEAPAYPASGGGIDLKIKK